MAQKGRPSRVVISLCSKTRMCKYAQKGARCPDGVKCAFAHHEEELRNVPDLFHTRLCKNFKRGFCADGDACRFAHGREMLRKEPKKNGGTKAEVESQGSSRRRGQRCGEGVPAFLAAAMPVGPSPATAASDSDDVSEPGDHLSLSSMSTTYSDEDSSASLLNWDPSVEPIKVVNGLSLVVRNSFLDVEDSDASPSRMSRSQPPLGRRHNLD
eukprot:TRINITY_DN18676_c0_g1_i1.p1 TRINITY_DN18676_c0_g1~~TRINITY_DN18676_c0_g1_i1.p1  ORF type:complete len:243 (+),score=29.71 TRINITY_DN18676_c0_g1_i1:95-730(+)